MKRLGDVIYDVELCEKVRLREILRLCNMFDFMWHFVDHVKCLIYMKWLAYLK